MALKKSFETRSGIVLPNAYHHILRFDVGDDGVTLCLCLGVYESQAKYDEGKPPVDLSGVEMVYDKVGADNAHTQMYNFLKTTAALVGAEDV